MTSWKRLFGIDQVEVAIWVAGTLLVGVLAIDFFNDHMMGYGVALASLIAYAVRRQRVLRSLPPEGETSGGWRMADVEGRLAELESLHARVAELEERVDFSERLLAKPADRVEAPK